MESNGPNVENHLQATPKSSKIVVRQLPNELDWKDFEHLVGKYGEVVNFEQAGNVDNPSAIVTFKNYENAHSAVENLNNYNYSGSSLKVTMAVERGSKGGGGGGRRVTRIPYDNGGGGYSTPSHRPLSAEMPLRMVVNAKYVGAIIGQGGSNIRQITKDSKARCVVDVSRGLRDSAGNVEKVINIYGTPENASKACVKILEIVQRESQSDQTTQEHQNEAELKLRAHNNLVGRLIGKGGATIKKIMDDTNCTIFVSNIGELSAFNLERTITIKGATLDKMSQAEQRISNKLRQCFENDITNAPHTLYGGMHPLMSTAIPPFSGYGIGQNVDPSSAYSGYGSPVGILPPTSGVNAMGGGGNPFGGPLPPGASAAPTAALMASSGVPASQPPPLMTGVGMGGSPMAQQSVGLTEVVHIWVPNNVVGALIGTRGSNIRQVMRLTGAHIRIETGPLPPSKLGGGGDEVANGGDLDGSESSRGRRADSAAGQANDSSERRVTITGTDQQQYKAQFWIFQRICEQGYQFFDDVRLCTEIQVPSKMVGRIIGKGGQNVRELQRVTGAVVKIPVDMAHDSPEDTVVRISGNFNAVQAVQSRVRQLMHLMQGHVGVN